MLYAWFQRINYKGNAKVRKRSPFWNLKWNKWFRQLLPIDIKIITWKVDGKIYNKTSLWPSVPPSPSPSLKWDKSVLVWYNIKYIASALKYFCQRDIPKLNQAFWYNFSVLRKNTGSRYIFNKHHVEAVRQAQIAGPSTYQLFCFVFVTLWWWAMWTVN